MTCGDCGQSFHRNEGYHRPEGFLCRACFNLRLEDPKYAALVERQLFGLVTDLTAAIKGPGASWSTIVVPKTAGARQAVDSLVGLAVGDALGAPREGEPFDPDWEKTDVRVDATAPWTDDTQMALSVVDVLLRKGAIDQDELAQGFAERYEPWRGYGSGMHVLLRELKAGRSWRNLRDVVFRGGSYGNGSAMRVAPLGAYFAETVVDYVAEQARLSAEVTHAHPEGVAGAVAVALAAWLAARSRSRELPQPNALFDVVRAHVPEGLVHQGLLVAEGLPSDAPLAHAIAVLGNGSTVTCQDTVPLALWIAFQNVDDFARGIRMAVSAGGDADTLAAIVGGIIAARVGLAGIPKDWRDAIEPLPLAPEV